MQEEAPQATREGESEWAPHELAQLERARTEAASADVLAVYRMVDIPDGSVRYDHQGRWKGSINGLPYDHAREVAPLRVRTVISSILFEPTNYIRSPRACGFHADVGFRFHGKHHDVAIVYCARCQSTEVSLNGNFVTLLSGTLTQEAGQKLVTVAEEALAQ